MKDTEAKQREMDLAVFWRIQRDRAAAFANGGVEDPVFAEMRDELEVLRMFSNWPALHVKIDQELARGAKLRAKVFA